jgi:hypothetical protein
LETTSTLCGRKEPYAVAIQARSPFHHPLTERLSVAPGSYLHDQNQRVYCTPDIQGVSTSQHRSKRMIRLACALAVVCGVSLRPLALLCSALCLIPIPKSSIKRWMDDLGSH